METNANYTMTGIFVLSLLIAIIFLIIWLSSGFAFQGYKIYKVYMKESVSGLNVDSPVEFNGVGVGTVKSIEINNENPELVELLLNVSKDAPVSQGTEATLNSRGLTGMTYVALKDKSNDLRPLRPNRGEEYPIIKTSPSLFLRLDAALSQLTENMKTVASSVQSLLDKDNLHSIKEILINLDNLSRGLASNNQRLTTIMENTAIATQELRPLLRASITTMRALENQILPTTTRLLFNIDNITRTLSEVTSEVRQNPSVLLRGSEKPILGPGETR
ncbi:MAG: MCE family protein [Gammaproteobacteria bacterium]|nr:MCE family protein [Gammaproteobacteria bacterium]